MSRETRDINGLSCVLVDPHEFHDIISTVKNMVAYMYTEIGNKTYIYTIVRDITYLYYKETITRDDSSHIPIKINKEEFVSDYNIYFRKDKINKLKKIMKIKEKI
jgi:hypothetical protein